MQGMKLPVYGQDGSPAGLQFSNNPAWVLMDVLRRSGWLLAELDVESFAAAASYCDEPINTLDLYGNAITVPRFQCNLVLKSRRTAADVIRGIRNGSRLYLTYAPGGLLQVARGEYAGAAAAGESGFKQQRRRARWRLAEL